MPLPEKPLVFHHYPQRTTVFTTKEILTQLPGEGKLFVLPKAEDVLTETLMGIKRRPAKNHSSVFVKKTRESGHKTLRPASLCIAKKPLDG
ncbi:hypothetical protein [Paenibacillus sp. DMB20]|uniref:hypothetical protein n=1 Tax=Paenibacillus sp. DMB20 TaxID=1642570 RepID=UPI000B17908D|nr:hypothetical protein [Paenibacillus sp. DMB20]